MNQSMLLRYHIPQQSVSNLFPQIIDSYVAIHMLRKHCFLSMLLFPRVDKPGSICPHEVENIVYAHTNLEYVSHAGNMWGN